MVEKKKENKILFIIKSIFIIFAMLSLIYLIFSVIVYLPKYMEETEIKDSNFCESKGYTYYMIVDNGFASDKIICIDNEDNRHEFYLEEMYI